MNYRTVNTVTTRSFLVITVAAGMLLLVFATQSLGQIEPQRALSRDGLIQTAYLTQADISDDLEGNNDEYFYKFKAGPGKLTVIFEVTANETNAGAMLDLFGASSRGILSNVLAQGANGGSEQVSKSITLAKKQEIVIRIKALSYGSSGSYPGIYKLRLEGPAVNFNEVVPAEVTPQAEIPAEAPPINADQVKPTESAPPTESVQETTPADPAPAVAGPAKKTDKVDKAIEKGKTKAQKVLDLLDKVKPKKPNQ